LEFILFLATLAGAPLLVETLVPASGREWLGLCSSCSPAYFSTIRAWEGRPTTCLLSGPFLWHSPRFRVLRKLSVGRCVVLGLMISGCALTKYQSLSLLLPTALFLLVGIALAIPRRRGRILKFLATGPGLVAAVVLVATASHWLANLIWYGNPVYPLLGKLFPSHPWVPGWKGRFWTRAGSPPEH